MTHAAPGPISMTLSAFFTSTANQNPDNLPPAKKAIMGMMKKYLLNLLTLCSDEQFGQDAAVSHEFLRSRTPASVFRARSTFAF